MSARQNRAAMYLRVSRDDQTTENQRLVLARRWQDIVAGYGPNL
jgi:DNA invertase Pin-like site-specific DNA recombinase